MVWFDGLTQGLESWLRGAGAASAHFQGAVLNVPMATAGVQCCLCKQFGIDAAWPRLVEAQGLAHQAAEQVFPLDHAGPGPPRVEEIHNEAASRAASHLDEAVRQLQPYAS